MKPNSEPVHKSMKDDAIMRLEERSRHLSKHIFPREYGLPSVFVCVNPRIRPSFQDRENEIHVSALRSEGLHFFFT